MYGAKVWAVCKIAGREQQQMTMDFTQGDLRHISRLHLADEQVQEAMRILRDGKV